MVAPDQLLLPSACAGPVGSSATPHLPAPPLLLQSRWLLPFLFAHWLLVLMASIVGLRCAA